LIKNKLSIIFIILTVICIFSMAAIADRCGCSMIPAQEKIDVGETEEVLGERSSNEEEVLEEAEEEQVQEGEEEEEPEEDASQEEEEPAEESSQEQEQAEAPSIELEVYEGPIYSSSDNVCYYRIKANVTGTPTPEVDFSKDDSGGAWGKLKCQVNLGDPADAYTLKAIATNSEGSDSDAIDLTWGCAIQNNPPEILDITWDHLYIHFHIGYQYEITAIVVDPDGDSLTYSWSVSGGTIDDPTVNPMMWTTPGSDGTYDITLVVEDGNGGIDTKVQSRTVYPASMRVPIDEAGNIAKDVQVWNAPTNYPVVGDHDHDKPWRGFISFDITDLAGTTITDATLVLLSQYQESSPYDNLINAFWVNVINWGDDALELNDFDLPKELLGEYTDPDITINNQALIDALQTAIDSGRNRFQIMIRHKGRVTNNNGISDYVGFFRDDIHLNVNFTGP
jgi:hypothetical protein